MARRFIHGEPRYHTREIGRVFGAIDSWAHATYSRILGALKTTKRAVLSSLIVGGIIACSAGILPARGGLMLVLSTDGKIAPDYIKVVITAPGGKVLLQSQYDLPATKLPSTISIVSNGDETASATIVVSAWQRSPAIALDRRDAIVTQIPTDRVAELNVILSAVCAQQVTTVGNEAVSNCAPGNTCDSITGGCTGANVSATLLDTYEGPDPSTDAPVVIPPVEDACASGSCVDSQPTDSQPITDAGPPKFSFFVTSYKGMAALADTGVGFGGKLDYEGQKGILGADRICKRLAEKSMPAASAKTWRAFLSTYNEGGATIQHAKNRIGTGPWYDRTGALLAQNLTELLQTRPGTNALLRNDLPNEDGVPNRAAFGGTGTKIPQLVLTASDYAGNISLSDAGTPRTCGDWTTFDSGGFGSGPRLGHQWSFPGQDAEVSWTTAAMSAGCDPGVWNAEGGLSNTVAYYGGYGGIYCFALEP